LKKKNKKRLNDLSMKKLPNKTALKDVDCNKDVGEKKEYKDISKPPRTDRENQFSKRKIQKENKSDYKDTVFDKDLKMSSDKIKKIAQSICSSDKEKSK